MNRPTLAWIAFVALAVRTATLFALRPCDESLLSSAHHEHASIAKNLAEGRGFRFNFFGDIDHPDLTSQQAPFVPGLLASAYVLFGVESPPAFRFVIALQVIAGAIMAAALADAVFQWVGDRRLAFIAAMLAAFYPPFFAAIMHLQALPWNLLWLSLILSGGGRLANGARRGGLISATAAIFGLYTDPILAVAVAAVLFSTVWKSGLLRPALGVVGITAFALSPWIARNYVVHGRLEFVKDSLPYVFWQGNTLRSAGTDKLPVAEEARWQLAGSPLGGSVAESVRRQARSINDASLSERDLHELARLPNEAARMDWFARRIREELIADPAHYLRMCLRRLQQWVWFDETNPNSFVPIYRWCYALLVVGALTGFAADRRRLWPFAMSGLALSAVHVLVITSARFRVSFELLLIPGFSYSLSIVWEVLARRLIKTPIGARMRNLPT